MRKRVLSIWLAVCVILTMLPISALAEETSAIAGKSGEITAFATLAETEKNVKAGTAVNELELPEKLTATVRTAVAADGSTSEEAVQDTANQEGNSVSANLTPDSGSDVEETNKQQDFSASKWKESTVDIPVTWTSEPEYDGNKNGEYVFTPVTEGYTVSAELPEITVTVGTKPLMMALRTAAPAGYGDFSVSIDEDGAAPVFSGGVLTFNTAGEYTVGMADGKTSTANRIVVTAGGVTLNLNGIKITAPGGSMYADGKDALTAASGVTLHVIADSSLNGGAGGSGGMESTPAGSGGAGVIGNVTVAGTAALTVTGGSSGQPMMGPAGKTGIAISNTGRSGGGTISVSDDDTVSAGADAASATEFSKASSYVTSAKYVVIMPSQARWGVAGEENAAPGTWAGSGSLTSAMTYANSLAGGTAYIQLLADADITAPLEFASGKTAVLDLNGRNIDGGGIPTGSGVDRNVLIIEGGLTLGDSSTATVANQGKITGGHGTGEGTGGGVYITSSGSLTMTGCNITGNTAVFGGGVGNDGTFTMTGGNITGNSCIWYSDSVSCGGGVTNTGTFNMRGGSITGNTVVSGGAGGGVLDIAGGMTLSGNINISGNTVGTASDNVALARVGSGGGTFQIAGALTNSTAIGVSIVQQSHDTFIPSAGVFTFGDAVANSDYISKFVSDYSDFSVVGADDNQLRLAAAQAITRDGTANGSFTVKVNGNEVPSAIEGQTVTVTPMADANYEPDRITVTRTGDTGTTVPVTNGVFIMPAYGVTVNVTFKAGSTGGLTDAQKLAAAQAAIMAAINRMSFSNSTTEADILSIAQTASLYGVAVTWDDTKEYTKTEATSSDKGFIRGTLKLTLHQENSGIGIDASIARLTTDGDSKNGSGNGGSSGNGSAAASSPSTKPTEPVTGNTENKAVVDNRGNANVSLTDKNITDAIADAKAEAAKRGVNVGDITTVIHVTTEGGNASTVTVNLPKTTQEQVIVNKSASVQLVIDRPDLTLGISLAAITEINRQAKADVQLSAARMDNLKLSGDAKAAIGNRPVFEFKATYGNGRSVTSFGNGRVSVEIPYTLQKGEDAGSICAVYVDTKGRIVYLTDSSYDAKRGTVVFSTSHFSTYGIAHKTGASFHDIDGHWAKDDILFAVNRGILTGTGSAAFSPNASLTRGMFVTALGRLAAADTGVYKKSGFSDVKNNTYYMGYAEWSAKNNILTGTADGKFNPDGTVTREQMAVAMDRYAAAAGFKLPEVHTQNTFADNTKISVWAAPSVKRLQMAGIMQGKNNNDFDPQGTVTRAEASAVLHRFVERMIFSSTAQGWIKNDSGQWMFFKDRKALTGWQTVGGSRYCFDSNGIMAAGKWLQTDGKWYYFNTDGTPAKNAKIDGYETDENGVRKTM